ncbi:hypothetical protein [Micromonospora endophytica]|nr:hypothetical protein [Micromonospora endophytica]
MEHSPPHKPRPEPELRIGPWLYHPHATVPQPRRLALPAAPAQPALPAVPYLREKQPAAVRPPAVIPAEPAHHGDGRLSHRLMLAGVAAAVLGLMLTMLWPTAQPPVVDADGPPGWTGRSPVGLTPAAEVTVPGVSPSVPEAGSSVGGVSSTRPVRPGQVSAPARSPSAAPTPTTPVPKPSTPTAPPTTSSPSPKPVTPPPTTRPAAPPQLSPLPAWRERDLRSVSGGAETSIEFVNLRSRPVILYWIDHQGRRRQYAVIQPGQSHRQQTYVGHPWVVTNGRGQALVCFEPTRTPARAEIG